MIGGTMTECKHNTIISVLQSIWQYSRTAKGIYKRELANSERPQEYICEDCGFKTINFDNFGPLSL